MLEEGTTRNTEKKLNREQKMKTEQMEDVKKEEVKSEAGMAILEGRGDCWKNYIKGIECTK